MSIEKHDVNVANHLIAFLKSKGITKNGIAGCLANFDTESALYLNNLQNSYNTKLGMTDDQYVKAVDDGTYTKDQFATDKAGFGLCQWTSNGRKANLWNWAKGYHLSIADEKVQFDCLMDELEHSYKTVLATLKNPNATIDECASIVMTKFERPADQSAANIQKRINKAYDFYKLYLEEKEQSNGMNLHVCIFTKNDCYKKAQKMKPAGIVVHSTGANNPNLKRYVQPNDGLLGVNKNNNSWNRPNVNKCVHAFIGKDMNGDVQIYQTLPLNYCAWGVGKGKKGSYNYSPAYIQFEICEDNLSNKDYFDKVMKLAQEFCASLVKEYGISLENVISHKEAAARGYASSHKDVDHWLAKFGLDMNWFRYCVEKLIKDETPVTEIVVKAPEKTVEKAPTQKTYTVKKGDTLSKIAKENNVKSYKTIADLNGIKFPYTIRVGQKLLMP